MDNEPWMNKNKNTQRLGTKATDKFGPEWVINVYTLSVEHFEGHDGYSEFLPI